MSAAVDQLNVKAEAKAPKERREILCIDNMTDEQFDQTYKDDDYHWAEKVLFDCCPGCRVEAEFKLDMRQLNLEGDLKDWVDTTRSASGLFVRAVLGGSDEWRLKVFVEAFAATGRPVAVHLDEKLPIRTAHRFAWALKDFPNVQLFSNAERLASSIWRFLETVRGEPFSRKA
jgi:hypothetical protein